MTFTGKIKVAACVAVVGMAWLSFAGAAERLQIVSSADGRLEVFAEKDDRIYHAWQTQVEAGSAATHWAWGSAAGIGVSPGDFVAGRDVRGRLFVAGIENGVIQLKSARNPNEDVADKRALDTHGVHGLQLATNADGRLEFFSLSSGGTAYSSAETASGNQSFANHTIGGTQLRTVSATPFRDGRLALVALGGDRRAWWTSQVAPNADWNGWSTLLGHDLQIVKAGSNADGRLEVFALGANNALYHRYETAADVWSEWRTLAGGPFYAPLTVARNQDGRLQVFLRDNLGFVTGAWQIVPNGDWSDFHQFGDIPRDATEDTVTTLPDGRLVFAARKVADPYPEVYIIGQVQPNGTAWQVWGRPPGAAPPPPPKPSIEFTSSQNNCYGPIGITCTFSWKVTNCSSCNISLVGKTGLGSYDTVFFSANNLPSQGAIDVKPQDTNTMFYLTATGTNGTATAHIEGKLYGNSPAANCAGCSIFYFKLTPPSNLLPCSKRSYVAPDEDTAKQWAKSEYQGWTVTTITASQFQSVGC